MLQNMPEINSIGSGGWGGLGGGGLGGFGLFGLLGLRGIGGFGDEGRRNDDGCARETAILAAIGNSKDATVAEGRSLAAAICATDSNVKDAQFALAIQAQNLQQDLKDQATALAIANNQNITELKEAGVAQTAAILARINDAEIQSLRDQLHGERRRGDSQDVSISIQNSNAQLQAQLQAQAQVQTQRDFDHIRRFDSVFGSFNQLNRNTQDIINLGTMTGSGTQANAQTNIK